MDEYLQEPYYCDDCDSWHISLYDQAEDGTIYQGDMDGNWDDVVDSLPTDNEIRAAWLNYFEWVMRNGKDPLGECSSFKKEKVVEKWTFQVAASIVGPVVVRGRKDREHTLGNPREFPQYVLDYLEMDIQHMPPARIGEFKSVEELQAVLKKPDEIKPWPHKKVPGLYLLTCFIDYWVDIEPSKGQIVKLAREARDSMLKTREMQEDEQPNF